MSEEGNTATLEAPVGPGTDANPPVVAPVESSPAPDSGGDTTTQVDKSDRTPRQRDTKTGKWVKNGTQGAAPVVTKPKDVFDDATYARAEEAGLTRYQAKKLGDPAKLEAEIARRKTEAERRAAEETDPPAAPVAPKAPAAPVVPAADAAAKADAVAELLKLPPLDPLIYSEEDVKRDQAYRAALQQQHDGLRELHSLSDKFSELEKRAQEDEQRRQLAVVRENSRQVDEAINGLGEEFAPIFGKGTFETLQPGYAEARGQVYKLAKFGREFLPDVPFSKLAERAAAFLYPDEFQQRTERDVIARAKKQGAQRGFSGASLEQPSAPHSGPSKTNPAIVEKARLMKLQNNGLAPK